MSLLPFPRTPIELRVADRIHADTRICQVARFVSLLHTQDAEGVCMARITVHVSLHAAAGTEPGEPLSGPGVAAYAVELSAANDTLVDAQTGAILAIRQGQNETMWQATIDGFPQATMLQGDFFEYLRENQPVLIGEMIRQHIQQADAMGRFA